MKASQLFEGEYYAWHPHPFKGQFTRGGVKVRVKLVETRKARHETNAKTYAHIVLVDKPEQTIKVVRAREIMDFWDDYKAESDLLEREREARVLSEKRVRARENLIELLITQKLRVRMGVLLFGKLKYYPYSQTVHLPVGDVLSWLHITDEEIDEAVDKYMEENVQS